VVVTKREVLFLLVETEERNCDEDFGRAKLLGAWFYQVTPCILAKSNEKAWEPYVSQCGGANFFLA
jgi:hypothetical protein